MARGRCGADAVPPRWHLRDGPRVRGQRLASHRLAPLALLLALGLEVSPGGGPLTGLLVGMAAPPSGAAVGKRWAPPAGPGAARAVEIGGASLFVKAPWKVDLISYSTTVGQPQPEYYVTLELDSEAGASLAGFSFQQIRGADWQFPFSPQRTYAFIGRPRRRGRPVPVEARWNQDSRTMEVNFPEPVPPGSTITTVLIPWFNPMQSDTYLFQVVAVPAGPNPVASPVGVGTLRIYSYSYW